MNAKLAILALSIFSLGAHAQPPAEPVQPSATPPAAATPDKAVPESGLTGQVLYQFLLGEIASQRGDLKLATEAYTDLAYKTRDVRVVRRAAEMAIYARDMAKASDMARLWTELEPQSAQARQLLITGLISLDRLDEAKPQIEAWLHLEGRPVGETFLQLHGLLARSKNKQAALDLIKGLAAGYPSVPEAHLAVAQSAAGAGQNDLALAELDEAMHLEPGSEVAALLKGQLLSVQGDAPALAFWKSFLAGHPDAARVRLAYARGLTKDGQFVEARNEFETLLKNAPDSPELHLAVGLLAMQTNDLDAAERHFSQALSLGYPDESLIQMYLGQVNELRQNDDKAIEWYRKVTTGDHMLQARLKVALILARQHKVDEAVASLKAGKADEPDKVRLVQTEAQILREAGRTQEACAVLDQALKLSPDAGDLLYDRAMIEEKLDRLPAMETDLRRLIKLQPDSAHAYNALGYTLIDRTSRVDEGIVLLEQALKLSPDDPFILDSMGWGQYKAGHLAEAVDYLRRAYSGRADPEIAAHLGEALWKKGDQDEAKRIWQEAAKAHPDNDPLRQTLSRFGQ
jgi:tetratricopeptide (TPR) repeat protein